MRLEIEYDPKILFYFYLAYSSIATLSRKVLGSIHSGHHHRHNYLGEIGAWQFISVAPSTINVTGET